MPKSESPLESSEWATLDADRVPGCDIISVVRDRVVNVHIDDD
jgi:hypothetical protein